MLSGLQASTKPVSSSTSGSASTITPDCIRRSACVHPFRKLYIEVAHNSGAGQCRRQYSIRCIPPAGSASKLAHSETLNKNHQDRFINYAECGAVRAHTYGGPGDPNRHTVSGYDGCSAIARASRQRISTDRRPALALPLAAR